MNSIRKNLISLEMNRILDKISTRGIKSLTIEEKTFLDSNGQSDTPAESRVFKRMENLQIEEERKIEEVKRSKELELQNKYNAMNDPSMFERLTHEQKEIVKYMIANFDIDLTNGWYTYSFYDEVEHGNKLEMMIWPSSSDRFQRYAGAEMFFMDGLTKILKNVSNMFYIFDDIDDTFENREKVRELFKTSIFFVEKIEGINRAKLFEHDFNHNIDESTERDEIMLSTGETIFMSEAIPEDFIFALINICEIVIVHKRYWEIERCMQDVHLSEFSNLKQVFETIGLDEIEESTFVYFGHEDLRTIMLGFGFTEDTAFSDFCNEQDEIEW